MATFTSLVKTIFEMQWGWRTFGPMKTLGYTALIFNDVAYNIVYSIAA